MPVFIIVIKKEDLIGVKQPKTTQLIRKASLIHQLFPAIQPTISRK